MGQAAAVRDAVRKCSRRLVRARRSYSAGTTRSSAHEIEVEPVPSVSLGGPGQGPAVAGPDLEVVTRL